MANSRSRSGVALFDAGRGLAVVPRAMGRNAVTTTVTPTPDRCADSVVREPETFQGPWAAEPLNSPAMASLRRQLILNGCKWDPQVGDADTLAPFPLVMKSS